MQQVIFGGHYSNTWNTLERYNQLGGGYTWDGNENRRYQPISTAGTISNLRVKLSVAPGAGKHWDFTLYLNSSPTALTLEIADAATSGSDVAHTVAVVGGDIVTLQSDPDNSPSEIAAGEYRLLLTAAESNGAKFI